MVIDENIHHGAKIDVELNIKDHLLVGIYNTNHLT